MQLTINTEQPLTEQEKQILRVLLGEEFEFKGKLADTEPKPVKKAAAKKTAAKKVEPKPEEPEPEEKEDDEDLVGGMNPTKEDAAAKATELVSKGHTDKVREALKKVGAKRVRDMDEDDVPAFLEALNVDA